MTKKVEGGSQTAPGTFVAPRSPLGRRSLELHLEEVERRIRMWMFSNVSAHFPGEKLESHLLVARHYGLPHDSWTPG
jgi:hypothetical protein